MSSQHDREKSQIDRIRDAGGSFTIGDVDDGTPIKEFIEMGGALHAVTLRGIYEIRLADQIDPRRTNPALPHNVHRRVLAAGLDSDLVRRVLMTAKTLFDPKFLQPGIEHDTALLLAFDALENLVAMAAISSDFVAAEAGAVGQFEARKQADGSMRLPVIGDIRNRCKTFIQKADHAARALHDIAKLFYPSAKSWTSLRNDLAQQLGSDNSLTQTLSEALPFLLLVRNTRDCLEHRNARGVEVTDFLLTAQGSIERPSIKIDFRVTHEPQIALSLFFDQVTQSLTNAIEITIASLCDQNAQSFSGLPIKVTELDAHWQAGRSVRFSYGTLLNGQIVPIG